MSRYLLGFTDKNTIHYVTADQPERGLCGARLVFVPQQQPANPFIHAVCQDLLAAALAAGEPLPALADAEIGTCPDCGGSVDLDPAGRVGPHPKVIMRGGRMVASTEACAGAGEQPEDVA